MTRPQEAILSQFDLAYCLHWAVRDAMLKGQAVPGKLSGNAIIERRRALEWVAGEEAWDEVLLDT